MKISAIVSIIASVLLLAGCQTMPYQPYARNVKVEPQTAGVIALKTEHRDEDRAKAQTLMEQNCSGKSVKVLEEGETVIGTETQANESAKEATSGTKIGSLWGIPVASAGTDATKNTNSVTTNKTEWQIKYKCAAANEAAPAKGMRKHSSVK